MGRAIKGTTIKVDGQAGPLGKGVPLARAAGPGGLAQTFTANKIPQNPQVPGFKGLMERATAAGKIRTPQQKLSTFARLYKKGLDTRRFRPQTPSGGFFRGYFNRRPPAPTPTKLPPPTGGLISKTVPQKPRGFKQEL